MFNRTWISIAGIVSLLASCATFPPPEPHKPEADPDLLAGDDMETTAEWLFVTSEADGKGQSECDRVSRWLQGEQSCTSDICIHARDLGREWLRKCKDESSAGATTVRKLVDTYAERAELPADSCVQQGTGLLRTPECGAPEACETQAQRWIAQCGTAYATPLFVLMLTKTLQRRFPDDPNKPVHEVKLDTRSCDELAKAVGQGVGCDGAACDPFVEVSDAWLDRCRKDGQPVPMLLAFQLADVRVGAGRSVEPMRVAETKLAEGSLPLLLSDQRGAVAWVCGVRPKNVKEYLEARRDCRPGEVIVMRVDGQQNVRTASVPHSDDAAFLRQFPFLDVKGERDARALADMDAFRRDVSQAVEQAQGPHPEQAISLLVKVMQSRSEALMRQAVFQKILTDADRDLAPSFKEWGKRKAQGVVRVRGADEQGLYARRALQNPLHDMTRDGQVSAGAYLAPPALTLDRWMPLSFLAYKDELSTLQRIVDRHGTLDNRVIPLRQQIASEMQACSQAEARIQSINDEIMACMLREGCTQDKIAALASTADPDRSRAQRARDAIARALASGLFNRGEIDKVEADRIAGGCLDP